jgi:hypothetical protein
MEVKVIYPDGKSKVLLNVPKYEFTWQTTYRLKAPEIIPQNSTIQITGFFDNSSGNRSNPDPTRIVRWGEPTSDEMMSCFVEYIYDRPAIDPKARKEAR